MDSMIPPISMLKIQDLPPWVSAPGSHAPPLMACPPPPKTPPMTCFGPWEGTKDMSK